MNNIRICLIAVASMLFSLPALAIQVPGPVVSTSWLAQHRQDVTVVDVRSAVASFITAPKYGTDSKSGGQYLVFVGGHIPGAKLVNFGDLRGPRQVNGHRVQYLIVSKTQFQEVMQKAGVDKGDTIIIVPLGTNTLTVDEGTRLYWELQYYGQENMAILDGGTARWLEESRPVSTAPPANAKGNWTAASERTQLQSSSQQVADAMRMRTAQLLDARSLPQYFGIDKRSYVSAYGHIPGALVYPPDMITAPGKAALFLSASQYRQAMEGLGIKPDAASITYCNSGHLASGLWFALHEIVGNKNVSLYDGSMHEWTLEGYPTVRVNP